jgi:hypothetical protein
MDRRPGAPAPGGLRIPDRAGAAPGCPEPAILLASEPVQPDPLRRWIRLKRGETMKGMKLLCPILLALFLVTPALAEKPNLRHGFYMSLTPGVVSGSLTEIPAEDLPGDEPLTVNDQVDYLGLTLAMKLGFTRHIGLQLLGRASFDQESSDIDADEQFQQVACSGVYMMRSMKRIRPHVRLGFAWSRIRKRIPTVISVADTQIIPMVGAGLEWGSRKTAFFAEIDYAAGDYFQDTIIADDKTFINLSLGAVFKFYKD